MPGQAPAVQLALGQAAGFWRDDGVACFLGLPFAQAPVGPLRFAAPQPPEPWEGVRQATAYGPTADRVPLPDDLLPESIVPGDATLNLNVFTPALASGQTGLPVMVWIHGGGYISGSPKNDWYEALSFHRDGVITVTIDHRLGFDGFGLIDGAPSNRGVRDWLAALEWVRDNIAAFGGDPARVTLAGQSAGGGVVLHLLAMPQAQPLFRAAISLSGAIEPVTPERARREASRVAQLAKVTPDRAGFASLTEDELRLLQPGGDKTPVRDRLRGLRAMWSGQLPVGPLIDGGLIPCHPLDAYAQGTGAGKPVLISTMDEEMTGPWGDWIPRPFGLVPPTLAMRWLHLTPAQARAYAGPRRALGTRHLISQAGGDLIFRRLALEVATLRGGNTWLARMPWRSPTFGDARHVVDMPFFWDVLDWPSAHKWVGPEAPQAIADALHGAAVKLIKGEPLDWPEWRPAEGHTLVLGEPVRVERHGYADVRCLARL